MSLEGRWLGIPVRDWLVIFLFAVVRVILSAQYTLGVDEAHYALYGLHLDWSYFDHPPLLGWVNSVFLNTLGVHDWVVRLPAILVGILSSAMFYRLVLRIGQSEVASRWAVLALNVSFLCFGLFLMFLPDTLLLPLTLWLIFIVLDLLENPNWKNWLTLGICLGLCGLTKYTAVFFVPSLIAISLQEKVWRRWLSLKFIAGCLLAFILILPVLYWNWLHHWISFAYQTGHLDGETHWSGSYFLSSLAGQVVAYSPFLVLSSLAVILWGRQKNKISRVSLWMVTPCMLFFLYSGFKGFTLPHWSFIFFAVLFAVAFGEGFRYPHWQKALKISTLLSLGVLLVVLVELLFHLMPFKNGQSPYTDLTGWPELHDVLKDYKNQHPELQLSIGIANWTLGSRSVYYFSDVAPVFVLDNHYDQFDIWENGLKPQGDLLLLHWKGFDFPRSLNEMCKSHELIDEKFFHMKDYLVTSAEVLLCKGYVPAAE